jgi:hypothetical protein
MPPVKGILKVVGIVFSVIIILLFLNFTFGIFLSGWNNPW